MLNFNYIIGLVDGEGSFTVYVKNPDLKTQEIKRRVKAEPRFYLKINEKDKSILFELKYFFGCGNVYFQPDERKNHRDCYRYEVANRKDITEIIIPFFKKNQLKLTSKKNDFKIFCKIVDRMNKKEHLTESGLRKIYKLKQKMH